jgi:hypothetical protein
MGADYEGQEKALAILRALPREAKEYIAHHVRNCLAGAVGNIDLIRRAGLDDEVSRRLDVADECLAHAVEDLKKIEC